MVRDCGRSRRACRNHVRASHSLSAAQSPRLSAYCRSELLQVELHVALPDVAHAVVEQSLGGIGDEENAMGSRKCGFEGFRTVKIRFDDFVVHRA